MQVTAWIVVLIELDEITGLEHLGDEFLVLFRGAVAPVDIVGLRQLGDLGDPVAQGFQSGIHGVLNRVGWLQEAGV